MTDVQIIMFCTVVLAICACWIHNSTKIIAARLHCRAMGIDYEKPAPVRPPERSPYGIIHTLNDRGGWGYCITKHGEIYRASKYSSAPVYSSATDAISVINTYEKVEGYALSTLG